MQRPLPTAMTTSPSSGRPVAVTTPRLAVILRLLEVNFEMEGYHVLTASDGEEGLARARAERRIRCSSLFACAAKRFVSWLPRSRICSGYRA